MADALTAGEIAALKAGVEKALGFPLSTFTLLAHGSSPNFKAVRASDGFPFLAKLLPPQRAWAVPVLRAHLEEMDGTKCVRCLFPEAAEAVGEYHLICLEWCEGSVKMPDQLTEDELTRFLAFYQDLSAALQKTTHIEPADPIARWREQILNCRGWIAAPIRRLVAREIPASEVSFAPSEQQIIFGDFHHGNLLFRGGEVAHVLDLESFCYGHPTEDFVRYFTCAYDHLKWRARFHRRAMLRAFETVVRRGPYPSHAWCVALNGVIIRRLQDILEAPNNPLCVLNLLVRVRFYFALKRVASSSRQ